MHIFTVTVGTMTDLKPCSYNSSESLTGCSKGDMTRTIRFHEKIELVPVVQSIVSLTSSLRAQLVKCFMTL